MRVSDLSTLPCNLLPCNIKVLNIDLLAPNLCKEVCNIGLTQLSLLIFYSMSEVKVNVLKENMGINYETSAMQALLILIALFKKYINQLKTISWVATKPITELFLQ